MGPSVSPQEKSAADLLRYAENRKARALRTVQDLRAELKNAEEALQHARHELRQLRPGKVAQ